MHQLISKLRSFGVSHSAVSEKPRHLARAPHAETTNHISPNLAWKKPVGYVLSGDDIGPGEDDYVWDYLTYMLSNELRTVEGKNHAMLRMRMLNYAYDCVVFLERPLETYYLAVYLIDYSLQLQEYLEHKSEVLATFVLGALEIYEKLRGIAHHFQYSISDVHKWERELLRNVGFEVSGCHALHFLRVMSVVLEKKYRKFYTESWSLSKKLLFAASLSHDLTSMRPSKLAAAISRIVLELAPIPPVLDDFLDVLQYDEKTNMTNAVAVINVLEELRDNERAHADARTFLEQHGHELRLIRDSFQMRMSN